jgi:hypothetical protein
MPNNGLCECGCGGATQISKYTNRARGWVRGEPRRFISGHNRRANPENYTVTDCGHATPCWVWNGTIDGGGYGRLRLNGVKWLAHRYTYEKHVGPIPTGLQIDHLCRNRACVNPNHLEPVTAQTNLRRGLRTKLRGVDVAEIKSRLATSTPSELAAEFGVHVQTIWAIRYGRSWKDVAPA